jgi:hypothetical protein
MTTKNKNKSHKIVYLILITTLTVLLAIMLMSMPAVSTAVPPAFELTANYAKDTSDSITIDLHFSESSLSFEKHNDYDIVSMPGCGFMTNIGEPMLLTKSVFVAVPAHATVKNIEVVAYSKTVLPGEYTILPAQPPVPTMAGAASDFVPPGPVYNSSNIYPGSLYGEMNVGSLRGYKILSFRVFPLLYKPAEKELILYDHIVLDVTYTTPRFAPAPAAVKPEQDEFYHIVKRLVQNPGDVDERGRPIRMRYLTPSLQPAGVLSADDVEYVIITSSSLENEFRRLADWKTKKGVPARLVNVSWIVSNYAGNDTQEKIRNFISDAKTTWDTKWVLLGGDTSIIPDRKGYGYTEGYTASIPADLYYSDLDGNWNADGDSTYGEVEDNIDLYPDVFVGRASVDSVAEAQTFVNKTLTYERTPPMDYELDMLFLAEKLWNDPATWGGDAKNVLDTRNIPPKYDPITKKYEMYGNASREIAIDEMNAGPHIVNHVGHGGYSGFSVNGWVSRGDADGLTNSPKNFILYTISCNSNSFDRDCVAEHYMNNDNGGSVGYIGNSRYGWFEPGYPGEGPSDLYDQEFFNATFNNSIYNIGETVAYSKIRYIPDSQEDGDAMRWLQYALNLLGDPELPIWTGTPESFSVAKPFHIPAEQQTLVINVSGSGPGPVEDAVVCIQKIGTEDESYNVSKTNESGAVNFTINPGVGILNVTITKHNYRVYEGEINVYSVISTNSTGVERNEYLPGENVSVKAEGLSPNTNYTIWIQKNPVEEGDVLNASEDPSTEQENVTTADNGNLAEITLIWAIPEGAPKTYQEYDIVFDKQDDGDNTGKYNANSDGIDSAGVVGFLAPVPELPTIVLFGAGLIMLAGLLFTTTRLHRFSPMKRKTFKG